MTLLSDSKAFSISLILVTSKNELYGYSITKFIIISLLMIEQFYRNRFLYNSTLSRKLQHLVLDPMHSLSFSSAFSIHLKQNSHTRHSHLESEGTLPRQLCRPLLTKAEWEIIKIITKVTSASWLGTRVCVCVCV